MEPIEEKPVALYSDNLVEIERECDHLNDPDLCEKISHILLMPAQKAFGKELVIYQGYEEGYEQFIITSEKIRGSALSFFLYLLALPFTGPMSFLGSWLRNHSISHKREYLRAVRSTQYAVESMNIRNKLWYELTIGLKIVTPLFRDIVGRPPQSKWDLIEIDFPKINAALILGSMPTQNDKEFLTRKCDIHAVLSVMEDWENDGDGIGAGWLEHPITPMDWRNAGVDHLQITAKDLCSISSEKINSGVDFIRYHVESGRRVLVHCKLGMNRSALIVMGYLMKYCEKNPSEALELIQSTRPQVFLREIQMESAEAYNDWLKNDYAGALPS